LEKKKILLGRPNNEFYAKTKMSVREIGWEGMD
jgi:hypothetical protein